MTFDPTGPSAGAARPDILRGVDLAEVAAVVERRVAGKASHQQVMGLLHRLLAEEFREARIGAYVPILLARRACEALRGEVPPAAQRG